MKILLIKASAKSPFKAYKKYLGSPPQSIFSLAAATPIDIDLEMVDETADMKPPIRPDADLIVIFGSTPDAIRAYELSDFYRKMGITVIIAGLHASFLPDEALTHADTVIIGEAENIWSQLLADFRSNTLQQRYQSNEPVDISNLNYFPTNHIKTSQYNGSWSVLVSRGCTHRCSFCLVPPFFKGRIRYRPVGQVIDEIKQSGANWLELHSDNLTADRDYALELFTALKPLGINWSGETTINIAKDEELLRTAAESGLSYLLVGLETPSKMALKKATKGFVKVDEVKEYIRRLHEYDIAVDSAMVFGFDEHDSTIFKDSMDYVKEVDLDVAHGVVLIPFPGSRTFDQLDREGRILTTDWSKYDGAHAVFQPKGMTPAELEQGAKWFNSNFYTIKKMFGKRSWVFWG